MDFYLEKKYVTHAYYINLVEAIIKHEKLRLTYRESSTVALSHHAKIRENY